MTNSKPKAAAIGQSLLQHDFERLRSYEKRVPTGYKFVPKGDPFLTRKCRELTGESGKVLHIVYSPATGTRLGLHCPGDVYSRAISGLAATADQRQKAAGQSDSREKKQIRTVLTDMYPRMPLEDLERILAHGFERGSKRVGRTTRLDTDDRAELAVVAYIRHHYTDYDNFIIQKQRQVGRRISALTRAQIRYQIQSTVDLVLHKWIRRKPSSRLTISSDRSSRRQDQSSDQIQSQEG